MFSFVKVKFRFSSLFIHIIPRSSASVPKLPSEYSALRSNQFRAHDQPRGRDRPDVQGWVAVLHPPHHHGRHHHRHAADEIGNVIG